MTKFKHTKKLLLTLTTLAITCMAFIFGIFAKPTSVNAYVQKDTSLSNLDFSANQNTTSVYSSPNGWSKGFKDSNADSATSGAINLDKFDKSEFYLDANENPHKLSDFADDYVLMINAKNSSNNTPKVQYYTNNNSLSLKANSSYKIVVWTKVLNNSKASIYITGLKEDLAFENINHETAYEWTAYTFYITTGVETQNVKTELWLGAKPSQRSVGAVFFDNIEVYQISENEIPNTLNDKTIYKNLNESTLIDGINSTFENTELTGWTLASNQMQLGTYAEVINQSNNNISNAKGIEYLGTDLSKNNKNAFVLYTDKDVKSYFGYKSESINIKANEIVKVSVNAKLSSNIEGSAYVKVVENDILGENGEPLEYISPVSQQITISSNANNKFTNNYTTCSFYIRGRSLYNTSFNIELWLGSKESQACGAVAFDNLKIEPISYEQFNKVTAGSTDVKVEMQPKSSEYNIANADFNDTQKTEKTLTYPLLPANWTHEVGNKDNAYFGVINTNNEIYNETYKQFGSFSANPGNPKGFLATNKDTNNVLLMYNNSDQNPTYQSVTSSNFEVSANKFYKLSFAYKLIATSIEKELLNVYVIDDAKNILYLEENISSNNAWDSYEINISTNAYTNKLNIVISLGTKENLVSGLLYIDNVEIKENKSMTEEKFANLVNSENVLDFQEGNFNLVEDNGSSIYTPLRYEEKLEVGTNPEIGNTVAIAGAVDGNKTMNEYGVTNSPKNENALKYMLMIQTHDQATHSLTAKDTFSLEANKNYKFTIDIITKGLNNPNNEEEVIGAEFSLTGLEEKLTGIVAKDWTTYTIYVKCTTATEINLRFALSSSSVETAGIAFFDNFKYSEVETEEYNSTQVINKDNTSFLFIGNTDEKEENNDSTSSEANLEYLWMVIPSLIFALALILALIVYFMKKLKIKKWEKKKVSDYDREKTVHRDVIRAEAEKIRNEKVKEVKAQISELQNDLDRINKVHQDQIHENRQNRSKGISRAQEKEFKHYAKQCNAIENRIAGLNSEIDNMNTPEYLLSIQHQIAVAKAKQDRKDRETKKKSRK